MKKPLTSPDRWEPIKRFVKFPIERVHIELTNRCNFACSFCPMTMMTRKKGAMELSLAFKIMDEIAHEEIAEKVVFHIMGEPFLYKELPRVLEYGKKLGLPTTLSTNGSLLNTETADVLIDAGLKKINVSLQTPDARSWSLRGFQGISFDEYQQRILEFAGRAAERKSSLEVRILVMVTKKRKFLEPYTEKVDIINDDATLKNVLKDWANKLFDLASGAGDNRYSRDVVMKKLDEVSTGKWQILHVHPNFSIETYHLDSWGNALGDKSVVPARIGYCSGISDHFGVLWDGRVVYCCRDYDGKTSSGNIRDSSLVDVLNSPSFLKAVYGFNRYLVKHPYCRYCLGGGSMASSLVKQVGTIFLMNLLRDKFYQEITLYE